MPGERSLHLRAGEQAALDPRSPIELRHIRVVVRSVTEAIAQHISDELSPLIRRIEALEAKPQLEYLGVHETGREYKRGQIITHDGSMWFCKAPTRTEPPGDHWQCCVKRGRDVRGPR